MKIETVFIAAAFLFVTALAAIAYRTGGRCHEEPPSDGKRVETGAASLGALP